MSLNDLAVIVFIGVALKAMLIGSEFSFYYWLKYGKRYTKWYNDRPDFKSTL